MSDQHRTALIVEVRPGDVLRLVGRDIDLVDLELIEKSGKIARLRVLAPRDVEITKDRREADKAVPCLAP